MATKSKTPGKTVSFDEYKTIKDEIIEISEQRFENILTRRLREFKSELMIDLAPRFDAQDARFNAMQRQLTFITWFLPFILTTVMALFKFIG